MKRFRVPVDIIHQLVCEYARAKMDLPELTDGRSYGVMLEFIVEGRNPNGTAVAISADVAMHELPAGAQVVKGGKS